MNLYGFVDPDDWVDLNMFEDLYSISEEEADIVMCSYIREFGTHSKVKNFHLPELIFTKDEMKKKVMLSLLVL